MSQTEQQRGMIEDRYFSRMLDQYERDDVSTNDQNQAAENAFVKIAGDPDYIEELLNGEYGSIRRIAEYLAAMMVCQDRYINGHVDSIKAIAGEMLQKAIDDRIEVEIDLLSEF